MLECAVCSRWDLKGSVEKGCSFSWHFLCQLGSDNRKLTDV